MNLGLEIGSETGPETGLETVLWIGIIVGGLILIGTLSERVIVDEDQIKITYPIWFPFFFRKNWSLSWTEVKDLKLRTTGQGGSVYYLTSNSIDKAYLLPTRVENFAHIRAVNYFHKDTKPNPPQKIRARRVGGY